MKTDDLINALVADSATQRPPIGRTLAAGLTLGLIATALLFALLFGGPRPGMLHSAVTSPAFLMKFVVTLSVAIPAYIVVRRLARPDGDLSGLWTLFAVPAVILGMWAAYELFAAPSQAWAKATVAPNWFMCVQLIPLLSLAPLAGVLYALRDGAPANPALAGAFGGLLSGALGATLYASHCSQDSALFIGLWYPIGIALVTLIGALLATRIARW